MSERKTIMDVELFDTPASKSDVWDMLHDIRMSLRSLNNRLLFESKGNTARAYDENATFENHMDQLTERMNKLINLRYADVDDE